MKRRMVAWKLPVTHAAGSEPLGTSSCAASLPASLRSRAKLQILGGILWRQRAPPFSVPWRGVRRRRAVSAGGAAVVGGLWLPTVTWRDRHWLERAHVPCELCRPTGAEHMGETKWDMSSLSASCKAESQCCHYAKYSIQKWEVGWEAKCFLYQWVGTFIVGH